MRIYRARHDGWRADVIKSLRLATVIMPDGVTLRIVGRAAWLETVAGRQGIRIGKARKILRKADSKKTVTGLRHKVVYDGGHWEVDEIRYPFYEVLLRLADNENVFLAPDWMGPFLVHTSECHHDTQQ